MTIPQDPRILDDRRAVVPLRLNQLLATIIRVLNPLTTAAGTASGLVDVSYMQGADSTGATDSTAAFVAAAASGHGVFVPKGTWKVNWTITRRITIVGEGPGISILMPFNTAQAAITYAAPPPNWTYASEVHGIEFRGAGKVGVGFTFGKTDPAAYAAGDELVNNVRFVGCFFSGLRKGLQFPAGNIGSSLYDCGFTGNFYGVYCLDAKFGGVMHAGNKYFYAGHFQGNDCGVYLHNVTEGFGGLKFDGTVFEGNSINGYIHTTNTFQAVELGTVWNEAGGAVIGGSTSLDQWAGTTLTTSSFTNRAWIFSGAKSTFVFRGGGVLTDVNLLAVASRVIADQVRCERDPGFGGHPCTVADADSQILLRDPETDGGLPVDDRVVTEGTVNLRSLVTASESGRRWYLAQHRFSKAASYGSNKVSQRFTTAVSTTSLVLTGTLVSDGTIYTQSNEFALPSASGGSFAIVAGTSLTPAAGDWVVFTAAVKWVSGVAPSLYFGNLGTDQIGGAMTVPATGAWQTIVAIGKSATGAVCQLQCAGNAAASTIRLSAMQAVAFKTRREAQAFLASGVYIDS